MTKRLLLGAFPDGGYGLRISWPGYDVTSNPVDNEGLLFNSDWPGVLPIYLIGNVSVSNSTVTVDFPDNLGYLPMASALMIDSADSGGGYQMFSLSNCIVDIGTLNGYVFQGTAFTNVKITLYESYATFYSNGAIDFSYAIYRIPGFTS